MGKYAILIYEDPSYYATIPPEGWPAMVEAHSTFVAQVFERGGSLAGGEALAPPTAATTIKGGSTVTGGPFVQTKETLNGIYVIEARDLDHAVEIAKLCPAPAPGGGVEVRPVVDPATNPF
ncbi:MAG: YciI family protein [Kineosporiaceae bacterium]